LERTAAYFLRGRCKEPQALFINNSDFNIAFIIEEKFCTGSTANSSAPGFFGPGGLRQVPTAVMNEIHLKTFSQVIRYYTSI